MNFLKTLCHEIREIRLYSILLYALISLLLIFIANSFTRRITVSNISMQPTIMENDLTLISKNAFKKHPPQRGDIIVFPQPDDDGIFTKELVKRVIAVPGDIVTIDSGLVFVNGNLLSEPYTNEPMNIVPEQSWVVPESSLFVLGDNRNHSTDSRTWGFVPIETISGKALCIYWPLSNIAILR